jgi:hypothetical protein
LCAQTKNPFLEILPGGGWLEAGTSFLEIKFLEIKAPGGGRLEAGS